MVKLCTDISINAKLKRGKRGQKRELTGRYISMYEYSIDQKKKDWKRNVG